MKKLLKNIFVRINGDIALKYLNRQPRVLFWHGVNKIISPDVEAEIIEISTFEKQINYLVNNYNIISIQEFERRYKENSFLNNEIVLTFDDGYANNLYIVEPILKKYNLPFTVFISTEHIENNFLFPTSINRIIVKGTDLKTIYIPSLKLSFSIKSVSERNNVAEEISQLLKTLPLERVKSITKDLIDNVSNSEWKKLREKYKSVKPMTWEELIRLSQFENVTIGSHCKWHICCHMNQDSQEVEKQIYESKAIIEERLQKECKYFAYPDGAYTEMSNYFVLNSYSLGFSTNKKMSIFQNHSQATIPRIGVPSNLESFKIITNLYPK